jgi:hypothetical protein
MQVLKSGVYTNGWNKEVVCTGRGYGGCGAKLKICADDLHIYITPRTRLGTSSTYISIICPECKTETDISKRDVPSAVIRDVIKLRNIAG